MSLQPSQRLVARPHVTWTGWHQLRATDLALQVSASDGPIPTPAPHNADARRTDAPLHQPPARNLHLPTPGRTTPSTPSLRLSVYSHFPS